MGQNEGFEGVDLRQKPGFFQNHLLQHDDFRAVSRVSYFVQQGA